MLQAQGIEVHIVINAADAGMALPLGNRQMLMARLLALPIRWHFHSTLAGVGKDGEALIQTRGEGERRSGVPVPRGGVCDGGPNIGGRRVGVRRRLGEGQAGGPGPRQRAVLLVLAVAMADLALLDDEPLPLLEVRVDRAGAGRDSRSAGADRAGEHPRPIGSITPGLSHPLVGVASVAAPTWPAFDHWIIADAALQLGVRDNDQRPGLERLQPEARSAFFKVSRTQMCCHFSPIGEGSPDRKSVV